MEEPVYSEGRRNLIEYIKMKLGYPTVDVELSDSQLNMCIEDALYEVLPWVVQDKYITIPAQECTDMTEYHIGLIIQVYKAEPRCGSVSSNIDVFNPGLSSSYGTSSYGSTVTELERMLYYQNLDYVKDNISYQYIDNKLYLDTGYPKCSNVTVRYSEECFDVDDIKDLTFKKFLRDFSVAFANELLGEIRGKVRTDAPLSLDYDHKYSKSSSELERLRQAISDNSSVSEYMSD